MQCVWHLKRPTSVLGRTLTTSEICAVSQAAYNVQPSRNTNDSFPCTYLHDIKLTQGTSSSHWKGNHVCCHRTVCIAWATAPAQRLRQHSSHASTPPMKILQFRPTLLSLCYVRKCCSALLRYCSWVPAFVSAIQAGPSMGTTAMPWEWIRRWRTRADPMICTERCKLSMAVKEMHQALGSPKPAASSHQRLSPDRLPLLRHCEPRESKPSDF